MYRDTVSTINNVTHVPCPPQCNSVYTVSTTSVGAHVPCPPPPVRHADEWFPRAKQPNCVTSVETLIPRWEAIRAEGEKQLRDMPLETGCIEPSSGTK